MPRRSGVGTEFGAFAKVVVFVCKKRGFGGFGHPRIVSFGAPARRHRQFWDTASSVLHLGLNFGAVQAPSCPVNPTFWNSGKAEERQKDTEGRVGNVPEGTELAEMPRRSGVGTEFGVLAKIAVFFHKKHGFESFRHPRIVALGPRRSGIVSFGNLVRLFRFSGSTLGPLRHQVAR